MEISANETHLKKLLFNYFSDCLCCLTYVQLISVRDEINSHIKARDDKFKD